MFNSRIMRYNSVSYIAKSLC